MPRPLQNNAMLAGFADAQAGYQAAKRTGPFKRRRSVAPLGAGADWHYSTEADYLWLGEVARDLDRNDVVIGQMVDRAVDNILQSGFAVDPDTGDKALDADLKARADEEFVDPRKCDLAGELTFAEIERLVLRDTFVAGDVFPLPMDGGLLQIVESHLCRDATGKLKTMANVFHGVEMDPTTRERTGYWFTREPIDPLARQVNKKQLRRVAAYDEDGEPNVLHVMFPKRATQTRGITALAPIVDLAGMHDDLQFAALLKAQLSAFFLTVHNREKGYFEARGSQTPAGVLDPDTTSGRERQKLAPGSALRGAELEKVEAWSPNIPNAEFFPHVRLVLMLMGANLGLPLVVLLLDASETNFSGYRGAVEQARLGFRRIQSGLKTRLHRPWWRHKVRSWAEIDKALRRTIDQAVAGNAKVNPYRHKWNAPGWPYVEPMKDATSDLVRVANLLTSPTRQCAERGVEWCEVVRETIRDRRHAIARAVRAAQQINERHNLGPGERVTWRDLAPLPSAERMAISMQVGDAGSQAGASAPEEKAT